MGAARDLSAQGTTAFSYQGRLTDNDTAANGGFDFRFILFDAQLNGTQLSSPVIKTPVAVESGLFTVALDFGNVFDGGARWLEIAVREAGSGGTYDVLTPRQALTPVPYALFAMTPAGPQGPQGVKGDTGPQGIQGVKGDPGTSAATGSVLASDDANDADLIASGMIRFFSTPAPAWVSASTVNQPAARTGHALAWAGTQLLVWGGELGGNRFSSTGASYDPASDSWSPLSPLSAPSARTAHASVWTGTEWLIWGGYGADGRLGDGFRFDPARQLWSSMASIGGPSARVGQSAAWTGTQLAIWGGQDAMSPLADGFLYDPAANNWSPLPPIQLSPRRDAHMVWTGDRLLIWGGQDTTGNLVSGMQVPLAGESPPPGQAISSLNAPSSRAGASAVWTGSRLLVWGGEEGGSQLGDGASYDPLADTWTALSSLNAPSARTDHAAVWTGDRMLIYGGRAATGAQYSAHSYDPATDTWRTLGSAGNPAARTRPGAAWNGTDLLIFGGESNGVPVGGLQRISPEPAWHLYRKL